jgi:acetyl-CoA C-acetyltransferase
VADPLTVYDCSLISDGAAAVILAPLDRAAEFTDKPVRVLGIAQASDYVALDRKPDITTFPAVRRAAAQAYRMAGVEAKDIQFAELHDCFTIAEIIATEDLGFVEPGEGGPYAAAGYTLRGRSARRAWRKFATWYCRCAAKRGTGRFRAIRWAWPRTWAAPAPPPW